MEYLSEMVFAEGVRKLALRFKLPSRETLDAYYRYLRPRFSNDKFLEVCSVLFARARRFPIPYDFVENAPPEPPPSPEALDDQGPMDPREPVKIYIKRGSPAHRRWEAQLSFREKRGYEVPRYNREGYAAPVVVVLGPEEYDARVARKKMGIT